MKKRKEYRYLGVAIWLVTAGILIIAAATFGYSVWSKYKDNIIQKQEEQMLIVADSLADNLEEMALQYALDVSRASSLIQKLDHSSTLSEAQQLEEQINICKTYMASENSYTESIGIYLEDESVIWESETLEYSGIFDQCIMNNDIVMTEKQGTDGFIYFCFEKEIDTGKYVRIVVDVKDYYEKMIANIQLGTNGYVVVKNESCFLFMHPADEQIGKNAIYGREQLYGDVDLESLENMFREQNENDSGVTEYYSYWWTDTNLPRVKKVSAYSHADIGNQFLVVSAVMDYTDINDPIMSGFRVIALTIGGIVLVIVVLAGAFVYSSVQSRKSKNEITYLKNLNKVLEQTKRGEEALAHQQRLQIMGTMTGGIAHEFNNMLTPIMGYSEMLLDQLPEDSEEYDYAHEIFDASEKAKDIIHQISSMSRKNMETIYSYIPIRKTLTRAAKMIDSVCPANVKLTVQNKFTNEGFLGNETQINQVLLNICVNAFHAIGQKEDGQVVITGNDVDKALIEEVHEISIDDIWKRFLRITIEDNGCGMDTKVLEQIFNPFFTTKAMGVGTGLGLSVAEQIIHSHKGFLFAKSKVGEGSTFFIYLPLSEKSAVISEEESEERKGRDCSILVVDDNGKIRKMFEKKFAKLGIRVHTVEDTEEATQELMNNEYSVLLVDQELSRTGNDDTGIRYAMTLQTAYPDLIKIVMTEQVKKEIIEAKQCGYIDGYLEKPVSDTQIIEEIYRIQKRDMSVSMTR